MGRWGPEQGKGKAGWGITSGDCATQGAEHLVADSKQLVGAVSVEALVEVGDVTGGLVGAAVDLAVERAIHAHEDGLVAVGVVEEE